MVATFNSNNSPKIRAEPALSLGWCCGRLADADTDRAVTVTDTDKAVTV